MGKEKATAAMVLLLFFLPILSNLSADLSINIDIKGGCGSTFSIGDEISFTITLSESAYVTVNVSTPDDEKEVVKNLYRSKGEHDFTYTVVGPVGRHSLVAKVRDKYGKIVEDACEFKVIDRKDSDNDGVPDSRDKCPRSACTSVDATGCPLDSDSDGVNDCEDQCPEEEGVPSENGCPETLPPEPPSSPPSPTSSLIHSGIPSSMLYVAIPIILLIIGLMLYRMKKKEGNLGKSKKEHKKLREQLDEDYIEDRISRKEYLKKKEELEGE